MSDRLSEESLLLPPRPLLPASFFAALLVALSAYIWMQCSWSGYLNGSNTGAYDRIRLEPRSSLTYCITGDASVTSTGYLTNADVCDSKGTKLGSVKASLPEDLRPGSRFTAVAHIQKLPDSDWGKSCYFSGAKALVRVLSIKDTLTSLESSIDTLRNKALDVIEPAKSAARALVAGISCGRATELNATPESDEIARTGLSHMVAVSGSHLALVTSFLELALQRMHARRERRLAMLLMVDALYVAFTGGSPSALRSLVMVSASFGSRIFGRRAHGISALSITAIGMIALNPGIVCNLGFQLSCASVLSILLFCSYMDCMFRRLRLPLALSQALACTLCAQAATLPLTVPVFGSVSLIAPLANLLLAPLMSALLAVSLGACLLQMLAPMVAFMDIPEALARICLFLIGLLSKIPYAATAAELKGAVLWLPYGFFAVIYLSWANIKPAWIVRTGAFACLLAGIDLVYWLHFAPASVTVLDVGQADAILIRDGSAAVLVDAGVDEEAARALAANHVYRLDAVVLTHWDADHCGGLNDIRESILVDNVYVAEGAQDNIPNDIVDIEESELETLSHGDSLSIGRFTAQLVWPRAEVDGNDNEDSLCMLLRYGKAFKMLLTGDTEINEEEQYVQDVGDIDVLKLGHHGSKLSVDDQLLNKLKPELAVASAGEGNSYGHPSEACIDAVLACGARFLCTIDAGDICIYPTEPIRVTTEKNG